MLRKQSLALAEVITMKPAQYISFFWIAVLFAAEIAGYSRAAEKLTLERVATVMDDDQPPFVNYAVEDLTNYLKELTSNDVPVRNTTDAARGSEHQVSIFVGQHAAREIFPSESRPEELGEEGFLL